MPSNRGALWQALQKPAPPRRSPSKKRTASKRRTPPQLSSAQRRQVANLQRIYPGKRILFTNTGRPYVRLNASRPRA